MNKIKIDSAKVEKKYLITFVLFIFSFLFSPGNVSAASMCISGSCGWSSCSIHWQPANDTGWVEYVNKVIVISSPSELALYSNLRIKYYTDDSLNRVLVNGTEILRVQSSIGGQVPGTQDKDLAAFSPNPLHIGSNTFSCQSARITDQAGGSSCTITLINGTPPTCSLAANPNPISIGDSATLAWTASGATSATIGKTSDPVASHAAASPAAAGSSIFSPVITTEYTFTASDGGCNIFSCLGTITVAPPSCTLTASEPKVISSDSISLTWQIKGPASPADATIDNSIGAVTSPAGTATTPAITASTTFKLSFKGIDNQTYSCSATVGISTPDYSGLVPCGRQADNPFTGEINESLPCDLCAVFYMVKNIINYAMTLSLLIAILILIASGLLYAFSAGDMKKVATAKAAITNTLIGFAIVFVAWILVSTVLQIMGYSNIIDWNQVKCNLQK